MKKPFILIYGYTSDSEVGAALFSTLREFDLDFNIVRTADLTETIGNLIEKYSKEPTFIPTKEDEAYLLPNENIEAKSTKSAELAKLQDAKPFILFCHMEKDEIMQTLSQLIANNARPIPLKAGLTENNAKWQAIELIKELVIEDNYVKIYQKLTQGVELLEELDGNTYTPASWQALIAEKDIASKLLEDYENTPVEKLENSLKKITKAYFSLETKVDDSEK